MTSFECSMWKSLPFVVLVKIYRYLPNKDRLNLSLTCRTWRQPFVQPEFWRHAKFHFDFNGVNNGYALLCPTSLLPGMCHLVVDCHYGRNTPRWKKELSTDNLNNILKRLVMFKTCRLVTLRIIVSGHISSKCHWFTKSTYLALQELISMQTCLKHLELTGTDLEGGNGIALLKTIATCCSCTITELSMDGLFREVVPSNTEELWQNFTILTDVTISYQYMSDHFLKALSILKTLMRLTVLPNVDKTFIQQPWTKAWKQLSRARPSLETRFYFKKLTSKANYMNFMLGPGNLLAKLWFSWSDILIHWTIISDHVATRYQSSLREMAIEIEFVLVWKKDFLDIIFKRRLRIEAISFTVSPDLPSLKAAIVKSVKWSLDSEQVNQMKRFTVNGKVIAT